jgi:hypothetical protein
MYKKSKDKIFPKHYSMAWGMALAINEYRGYNNDWIQFSFQISDAEKEECSKCAKMCIKTIREVMNL